jgi:hypothetical protein
VSFFTALILFTATQIVALLYDLFVVVERAPAGRVNWIDTLFILTVLNLIPFLFLVLPTFLILAVFAVSFIVGLYYAFKPFTKAKPLLVLLVFLVIGFQIWKPTTYLNDFIVMSTVVGIAALYIQGGLKPVELVLLGIGYSVYDFTLGNFTPVTFQLATKLSSVQIAPAIATSTFWIGAADVMLSSFYVVVLRRKVGIRVSVVCIALNTMTLGILGYLVTQAKIALPIGSPNGFPFAPWITIPFLALWTISSLAKRKSS